MKKDLMIAFFIFAASLCMSALIDLITGDKHIKLEDNIAIAGVVATVSFCISLCIKEKGEDE